MLLMAQTYNIVPVGDARSLPAAAGGRGHDQAQLMLRNEDQKKGNGAKLNSGRKGYNYMMHDVEERVLSISVDYAEPKPNKSHIAKGSTTPIDHLQPVDGVIPH
ncbi:hypothetical protein L7F22_067351 [Adiantum nelumboides]|nr:hypothetical protein [Adiantum nelumboides]